VPVGHERADHTDAGAAKIDAVGKTLAVKCHRRGIVTGISAGIDLETAKQFNRVVAGGIRKAEVVTAVVSHQDFRRQSGSWNARRRRGRWLRLCWRWQRGGRAHRLFPAQPPDLGLQSLDLVFVPRFQLLDFRLQPLKCRGVVRSRARRAQDHHAG
jgi:hypothetical protein